MATDPLHDARRDRDRDPRHDTPGMPGMAEGNDLAASTVELFARVRPHLQTIGIVIALLVGGAVAWTLIAAQRDAMAERSWDDCMAALAEQNPDRLDAVIRKYPGSPAARWSQMLLAESAITEGCQQLFGDRERARRRLETAVDLYTGILAERPGGLVGERAVFGLAKAREALGELDDARRGYEALVAEYPSSAVRGLAEQRIAALTRGSTREWYDWFASQDIRPPAEREAQPAPSEVQPDPQQDARSEAATASPPSTPDPPSADGGTDVAPAAAPAG